MSGIAMAACTIPGSVATFCSCTRLSSPSIALSSSRSANTRAGTCASARPSLSSHSSGSISRSSMSLLYVEDRPGHPAAVARLEGQPVVRHGLDEMRRLATAAPHVGAYAFGLESQLGDVDRDEALA